MTRGVQRKARGRKEESERAGRRERGRKRQSDENSILIDHFKALPYNHIFDGLPMTMTMHSNLWLLTSLTKTCRFANVGVSFET